MRPMFGGKIVEGEEDVLVFFETFAGFGILRRVQLQESVVRGQRGFFRRGEIHLMNHLLCVWLNAFRHLVEDIGSLVYPAALMFCFGILLAESRPETKCAVSHGKLGRMLQASHFQTLKNLQP